ncbi:MAG: SulP family inorganic anion transporter [Candidatus Gastranaerophilales bacterium]|nr:SulP family inorganic anion transporter [Candidatus Gastranaerophilales bacterium]
MAENARENNKLNIKELLSILKGDLLGGLTSGIIAIPLALAFGVASGIGALAGLYGAIVLCFLAAVFGGASVQISGPTGPMTVIVASAIAMYPNDPKTIFTIIVLAGIFQILLSLTRLAGIVKYVPYPVISGFMSGIGSIIIILQSNPFMGANVIGSPINTIINYPNSISQLNYEALLLGLITLIIVFFTPQKINRIVPSALIALVVGTILNVKLGFNVSTIGEISSSIPKIIMPILSVKTLLTLIPISLTLAIIGAVDSLLTALVIDSVTKTKHNPDKVLFGQGIGNAIAGLFGGIVGAGATMRTVVNIKSGGRTRLSAIIHALFLVTLLAGAGVLVKNVPMAVLAGILMKVGSDIIDFKFIKVLKYAPRHDLYVMAIVYFLTVFYDLIFAVGAGITLSALLFAQRVAKQTSVDVKEVKDKVIRKLEKQIEVDTKHEIRIVHIEGQFFFGSATQIISHFDELLGTKYLILNYDSSSLMDISAVFALEDIIIRLKSQHIKVMLVINNKKIEEQLKNLGIIKQIGSKHLFYNEMDAIQKTKTYLKRKVKKKKLVNKNDEAEIQEIQNV